MITSFRIQNFRCFQDTEGKNFGRINLFGGKNNAGKTALLEAIFLMCKPSPDTIIQLLEHRRYNTQKVPVAMQAIIWDNFFYQHDKNNKISFDTKFLKQDTIFSLFYRKDFLDRVFIEKKGNLADYTFIDNEQIKAFHNLPTFLYEDSKVCFLGLNFISNLTPNTNVDEFMTSQYERILLEGHSEHLLKAFQIIDSSIDQITTLGIGANRSIYLKRKNEKFMPMSMFGDAMNKIANFILNIIDHAGGVLLVDEIENGIHHENQRTLWKNLFDLCNEFDVQVFATSHSAEMIEAFKDVVKENNFDGHYFKMARHSVSDKITIQKVSNAVLEDLIENQEPYRK